MLAIALGQASSGGDGGANTIHNARLVGLELELARKQLQLVERGATLDEQRAATAGLLKRIRNEAAKDAKEAAPPLDTGPAYDIVSQGPPERGEMTPEAFLAKARAYRQALASTVRAESEDDLDIIRRNVYKAMNQPHVRSLLDKELEAREEMAEPPKPYTRSPLNDSEIAALPEDERFAERLYRAEFEALEEPITEGEDPRIRTSGIRSLFEDEFRRRAGEIPNQASRLRQRIENLENMLAHTAPRSTQPPNE